ncbi:aromatic-L-amino-acid decarboxylase-like [Ptychodera flava]|uniref:aromatic-L-amino-acid decarboxylase-like n=1 Tax=Ptychodera flava TaxID=63121 RepID=UPI003969CB67
MASPDKLSLQFKSLQIGPLERQLLSEKTIKFAEEHLRKVEEHRIPCFSMKPDKAAGLLNFPIEEGPKNFDSILAVFEDHVLGNGIQHNHGGYVGFVPGGGIYPSALADFLAAVTNRQATCPGAVRMENLLISWVAELYDFPKGFAGSLTSGGSTATVLAMQTARHSKRLKGRDFERTVVYVTEAVHICVQKALNVIGLFEAIIRKVPMDEEFRMIPSELLRMVRKDKEV